MATSLSDLIRRKRQSRPASGPAWKQPPPASARDAGVVHASAAELPVAKRHCGQTAAGSQAPEHEVNPTVSVVAELAAAQARLREYRLPVRIFGETAAEIIARAEQVPTLLGHRDPPGPDGIDPECFARAEEEIQALDVMRSSRATASAQLERALQGVFPTALTIPPLPRVGLPMACELATEQHAHPTIAAILKFLEILTLTWYHDLHRQVSQLETEGTPVPAPLREQVAFFVANTADLALMLTSLREQTLPLRIVEWLQAIMTCLQRGDLQGATTTYLELAIGNAPWPIGATMVGIHERSSREKLFSEKLAHIMDDQQRKRAILSVKGLISFARQLSSSSQ